MAKQTGLEKLLAQIDSEIAALQVMRTRLVDAQRKQPARKPRKVVDLPQTGEKVG